MIDKLSVLVLDRFDWTNRNLIVWDYKTGRPAKAAYRNEMELLWFYSKELHRLNFDEVRIAYSKESKKVKRKNPKGKSCGNVWKFSRIMHPVFLCNFPVEIPVVEFAILHTYQKDILELFMTVNEWRDLRDRGNVKAVTRNTAV